MTQKSELEEKISGLVSAFIADTGFFPEISIEPVVQIFQHTTGYEEKVMIRLDVKSKLTTL